ncbi:MAG TPA: hypothetical protein VHO46_05265 [Bacteroidales bacterium]|nr:hypothetical protein [Bacteroidales bacterium]
MKTSDEKYDKLLKSLRSEPQLSDLSTIENRVMKRILFEESQVQKNHDFIGFLFGWIYITWIRRALSMASILLLGFFIWQQNSMMNQIEDLQTEIRKNNRIVTYNPSSEIERRRILLRISEEDQQDIIIREKDIISLIDSINNLNVRYRDLINLIDENPGLKKLVEDNIQKKFQSKTKL